MIYPKCMLAYNELKKGVQFILDGEPYEVLEYEFLRMQQRKPVAKCKIKNLLNGKIIERNFHQSESFDEAELRKEEIRYLYTHRGEYWFSVKDNPSQRFKLQEEQLGTSAKFMKPDSLVTAVKFNDKIISVQVPIKIDLKIKESPPNIAGDSAKSGTKKAILETGAEVDVPLFVNTGDTIRVNTETGTYVERVEKGKE